MWRKCFLFGNVAIIHVIHAQFKLVNSKELMNKIHKNLASSPGSIDWRHEVWYVGTVEDVGVKPHRPVYSSATILLAKQV